MITTPQTTLHQAIPDMTLQTHIKLDQSMTSRHTCPCSSTLLRHISHNTVYWRCSHCRAPMSVSMPFD